MGGYAKIDFPQIGRNRKRNSDDDIKKFVDSFRLGDYTLREKFILDYSGYAIIVGYKIHGEEGICNALATLCMIPNEIFAGKLVDYGLVGYTINRIKTRCKNIKRADSSLRIPTMTAWRKGLRLKRVRVVNDDSKFGKISENLNLRRGQDTNTILLNTIMDYRDGRKEDDRVLMSDILDHAKTEFERIVIVERSKGFTDEEVAAFIGCSRAKVRVARLLVEKRWIESCKEKNNEA
jgi:hypothetical protein